MLPLSMGVNSYRKNLFLFLPIKADSIWKGITESHENCFAVTKMPEINDGVFIHLKNLQQN